MKAIEEKAKAYDEALERARALNNGKDIDVEAGTTTCEYIFPELKESESEMIRKDLIEWIKEFPDMIWRGHYKKDVLAWIEKQCEQKPFNYEHVNIQQKDFVPVEPKFLPGDWIIRSAEGFKHNTYLVKEVKDYYVCEELKGRRVTFTFNDVHNNFKLWDISDAKCGDVLISSLYKQPFVYNGNYTCDSLGAYFGLNHQGELLICDSHDNNWTRLTGICPATEEQSKTLFNKLHNSDYKWDSEKKELWHKYL